MASDYYRVLGVQPDAEEVVIRAAYLALMRRYHPDQNAEPTLEKAQEVSSAYAVLSDPERRQAYDERLGRRSVELPAAPLAVPRRRSSTGRNAALLIAAGTLALLGFVTTRKSATLFPRWQASAAPQGYTVLDSGSNSNDCNSHVDADAIRRAVFAQAGHLASGDRAALRYAANASIIRMSDVEADESAAIGHWRCHATVAIDLPPGTVTASGQSQIVADLLYTIDRAPGSDRQRIAVPDGERIATSLATVRRDSPEPAPVAMPAGPTLAAADPPEAIAPIGSTPGSLPNVPAAVLTRAPERPLPRASERAPLVRSVPAPLAAAQPRDLASALPSRLSPRPSTPSSPVRSAPAQSRSTAVAANLALLNRMSGMLYDQSVLNADPAKRNRLLRTRDAFVARLNDCATDDCRKATYLARNGEIVSIMRSEPS